VKIDLKPHKQFYKYINRGWELASEARIKLVKRERKIIVYLIFRKEIELRKETRGVIAVDVNENNVTMLVDGVAYLFETDLRDIVLGYHYRRKRIQEKYDKLLLS